MMTPRGAIGRPQWLPTPIMRPFHSPLILTLGCGAYMDLPRLVSLLATRALTLCRVGSLPDPFEGHLPPAACRSLDEEELALAKRVEQGGHFTYDPELGLGPRFSQFVRSAVYVNCWCMHAVESEALWRIYGHPTGIALTARYSRLVQALPSDCFAGCIKYIDYETDPFPSGNLYHLAMHKRSFFSHEHEVRIATMRPNLPNHDAPEVVSIGIDIDSTFDWIVVSPYAPQWFFEAVRALLDRFECKVSPRWSRMRP